MRTCHADVKNPVQLIISEHVQARFSLVVSAIISALGFRATVRLIPVIQRMTLRRGMFGACHVCFDLTALHSPLCHVRIAYSTLHAVRCDQLLAAVP